MGCAGFALLVMTWGLVRVLGARAVKAKKLQEAFEVGGALETWCLTWLDGGCTHRTSSFRQSPGCSGCNLRETTVQHPLTISCFAGICITAHGLVLMRSQPRLVIYLENSV